MTRRALLLVAVGAALLVAAAGAVAGRRAGLAAAEAGGAADRLARVALAAQSVTDLRASAAPAEQSPRASADILASLTAALSRAGLTSSTLRDLSPATETAGRAGAPARLAVRLTLEPVRAPDLGRFLALWRDEAPVWTVAQVELAVIGGHSSRADDYRAQLVLTAPVGEGDEP